jgi:hypothetical protein
MDSHFHPGDGMSDTFAMSLEQSLPQSLPPIHQVRNKNKTEKCLFSQNKTEMKSVCSVKTRLKILPVLTREHYTNLLHWV